MRTRKVQRPPEKVAGLWPPAVSDFRPLPARKMVSISLEDPRMGATDYGFWAESAEVADAIVRVQVRLTEASSFEPAFAQSALMEAGAFHVVPIVPLRPEVLLPKLKEGQLNAAQLPIPEAFESWARSRPLPPGLELEDVLQTFREVLG